MDSETLNSQWADICNHMRSYNFIDESQFNAFFSRIIPQAMSDDFLMVTVENSFLKNWIESHYLEALKQALFDLYHIPFTVIIEIDASQTTPATPTFTTTPTPAPVTSEPTVIEIPSPEPSSSYTPTSEISSYTYEKEEEGGDKTSPSQGSHGAADNPASLLTFETFVVGDSNRMAYSMAVGVAEQPGRPSFNPLFIYGKSGLGKTHLMRAIQNYVQQNFTHLKTVYIDSQELVNEYTEASAAHDKDKQSFRNFKQRFEEANVLLIDDIQHLQGKKQTLEIFFQIFNKLISEGRQIVLSADRAPKNIDVDERYYSRFQQGGTVDIQPPEVETKLGIVKSFIREYQRMDGLAPFTIPEDIQMYIAENSGSNIRELKGAVNKVISQVIYLDQPDITLSDIRPMLEDHFTHSSKKLKVEDIQGVVEKFYGVSHADLLGPKRSQDIVFPRHVAIFLCHDILDLPLKSIANKFGGRDHSTADNSIKKIEQRMITDRDLREEIEVLKHTIKDL